MAWVLLVLLSVGAFVARILFGYEPKDLYNTTPAIANRFTYDGISVPEDADSVYLSRGYYPPTLSICFHADKARIDEWVANRLKTKHFRKVPVPRDSYLGVDWFTPVEIRQGRAFVEDGTDHGERIVVDDGRGIVFFSN